MQDVPIQDTKRLCSLKAQNYIYHKVVLLRFGKLTMTEADLEIVDQTPRTPFRFQPAGLQPAAWCGLLEEHPCARPHRLHARFRHSIEANP